EAGAGVEELGLGGGGGSGRDDQLRDAGDARGDGAHDQRREIDRAAAGNVNAGAAERAHAVGEAFEGVADGQLRAVKAVDALDREVDCGPNGGRASSPPITGRAGWKPALRKGR